MNNNEVYSYQDASDVVKRRLHSDIPYLPLLVAGSFIELILTNFCMDDLDHPAYWKLHSVNPTVTGPYLIVLKRLH